MRLTEFQKKALVEVCARVVPGCQALYLFGSYASGDAGPESDVDLGLLAAKKLDAEAGMQLHAALVEAVGKEVDLVQMRFADDVINMQIISTGERLFTPDEYESDSFASHRFADYVRLTELRSDILSDIRARGSVMG